MNRSFLVHALIVICVTQPNDNELSKLKAENMSLYDQVQRLQNELHFYQVKYPSPHSMDIDGQGEQSWPAAAEIVTPLLLAYDIRTCEKQKSLGMS